ncbi:hypothetical protein Anas_04813 [Armadillidium nasatum]|uniref:Uncharacterized protein n=1 Tax=Armadillidium nasatum TaxID=96803 RepID=A0A5N5T2V0_9CRUS|nr:hypothetical protein Anas_04813 [Armadillidium nasatum]
MTKEEKFYDKNSKKTKDNHVEKNNSKEDDVKVRLRRTQSVAKAENITEGERKMSPSSGLSLFVVFGFR